MTSPNSLDAGIRAMPQAARATHASHRAVLRHLGLSVGIAIATVGSFAAGACAQDVRVRDDYFRQGQRDATYDAIFDGQWLYIGCISDHCAIQKEASDFIVCRAEQRLNNGGKWIKPPTASGTPLCEDPKGLRPKAGGPAPSGETPK